MFCYKIKYLAFSTMVLVILFSYFMKHQPMLLSYWMIILYPFSVLMLVLKSYHHAIILNKARE